MKKFLTLPSEQRRQIFERLKDKIGLPNVSIEKDLWVTQVLHALFSLPIRDHLIFKGGTSLSKAWKLIDRFSEDIDLAMDPVLIELPAGDLTIKQIKKLRKSSSLYVAERLTEMLRKRLDEMELTDWLTVKAQPNGEGDNTYPEPRQIYVHYKSVFEGQNGYLRSDIVLEVSARSLLEPVAKVDVKSMLSEHLPVKDLEPVPVLTAVAGKTMVEKMFMLHEMFSVDGQGIRADRKSRHLYDLYKMCGQDFAVKVIEDDLLWESVRHHREIYTSVKGMDYTPDVRGRLVLVPRADIIDVWRQDYERMCEAMIYGTRPSWGELMQAMEWLQKRVREAGRKGKF